MLRSLLLIAFSLGSMSLSSAAVLGSLADHPQLRIRIRLLSQNTDTTFSHEDVLIAWDMEPAGPRYQLTVPKSTPAPNNGRILSSADTTLTASPGQLDVAGIYAHAARAEQKLSTAEFKDSTMPPAFEELNVSAGDDSVSWRFDPAVYPEVHQELLEIMTSVKPLLSAEQQDALTHAPQETKNNVKDDGWRCLERINESWHDAQVTRQISSGAKPDHNGKTENSVRVSFTYQAHQKAAGNTQSQNSDKEEATHPDSVPPEFEAAFKTFRQNVGISSKRDLHHSGEGAVSYSIFGHLNGLLFTYSSGTGEDDPCHVAAKAYAEAITPGLTPAQKEVLLLKEK